MSKFSIPALKDILHHVQSYLSQITFWFYEARSSNRTAPNKDMLVFTSIPAFLLAYLTSTTF